MKIKSVKQPDEIAHMIQEVVRPIYRVREINKNVEADSKFYVEKCFYFLWFIPIWIIVKETTTHAQAISLLEVNKVAVRKNIDYYY